MSKKILKLIKELRRAPSKNQKNAQLFIASRGSTVSSLRCRNECASAVTQAVRSPDQMEQAGPFRVSLVKDQRREAAPSFTESDDRTQSHVEPHEGPERRSSPDNKLHGANEAIASDRPSTAAETTCCHFPQALH